VTRVPEKELYEFPNWNATATCDECGATIDVPDMGDRDADMKAPHWKREPRHDPFNDVYAALCDECYAAAVTEALEELENR
jgi:hypothetical protein